MGMVQAAKNNPVITSVAAFFVSITAIVSGTQALGIRIIPWATAGDIDRVEKAGQERDKEILDLIQKLHSSQQQMSKSQNALLLEFWEKRLEEANEELRANPASRSARKQKAEAEREIERINREESGGSPHP